MSDTMTMTLTLAIEVRPAEGQSVDDAVAEMGGKLTDYLTLPDFPLMEDYGTGEGDEQPWGGYDGPTIDSITVTAH